MTPEDFISQWQRSGGTGE